MDLPMRLMSPSENITDGLTTWLFGGDGANSAARQCARHMEQARAGMHLRRTIRTVKPVGFRFHESSSRTGSVMEQGLVFFRIS